MHYLLEAFLLQIIGSHNVFIIVNSYQDIALVIRSRISNRNNILNKFSLFLFTI